MIKPTVGRVVWYYPEGSQETTQPLAAHIAAVWSDRCVNLMVIEQNGVPMSHPPTSVPLIQDGDPLPFMAIQKAEEPKRLHRHCRWMPYQIGQASRTEAVEKQLAAK